VVKFTPREFGQLEISQNLTLKVTPFSCTYGYKLLSFNSH
jgi:hypothetical protein